MASLFANGSIVVWILALLALEAAVLVVLRRRMRLPLIDVLAALGAGACLLLALRSALRGDGWTMTALWLIVAFGAHLLDVNRRFLISQTFQKR